MSLYERYRPQTFADVLGQDKAVGEIKNTLARGWGGQAFWISGASGTGKSTLAWIIAKIGADEFFVEHVESARKMTPSELDKIEETLMQYPFGHKTGRAVIIDEAHGLRKDIIERLLGLLEKIPSHVVWIFTTTKDGQGRLFDNHDDAGPLLSRCFSITLTNQGLAKLFAERVQTIAKQEGMDGKPLAAYVRLAQTCKNNCRAMLQEVEKGVMKE
jgi:replication-associated recombination protein RarA